MYNLEYNKIKGILDESIFIEGTMGKWGGHYTFLKLLEDEEIDYV